MTALLMNLLAERPEMTDEGFPIQWLGIGEGALYALLGFLVTFMGIVVLIFFVWLSGKILQAVRLKKKTKQPVTVEQPKEVVKTAADEIPVEIRLAIIAAISAYYDGEQTPCEFKVKRIKRL